MADYIPGGEGDLTVWLINYANKIVIIGANFGITAAEIQAQQSQAQTLIAELANASTAKASSKKATAVKEAQKVASLGIIRANVAHLKANALWTAATGKDLQTDRASVTVDPATYKPRLSAKVNSGAVQLRFLKRGVQAINIYTKLQGETQFVFLQTVTRSTYTDSRPLKTQGIAEARQYLIIGVIDDKEIGLPSDIITVSFGG